MDDKPPVESVPAAPPEPIELKILAHKVSYECPRFKVNETIYQLTGEEARKTYKVELKGDLLVIIPRFGKNHMLIEETHAPSPDPVLTFPTGFLIAGMPVGDTAQSILTDATGCVAKKFHPLGTFHPSRYMDNVCHVMAADGVSRVRGLSEAYRGKIKLFSEQDIGSLLISRDMFDGLALASYVYYATSNYFAEVHNGRDNSSNTGEPQ